MSNTNENRLSIYDLIKNTAGMAKNIFAPEFLRRTGNFPDAKSKKPSTADFSPKPPVRIGRWN